jgi:hypothetical protein
MQCQSMYLVLAALHSVHMVDAVLGDYDPLVSWRLFDKIIYLNFVKVSIEY